MLQLLNLSDVIIMNPEFILCLKNSFRLSFDQYNIMYNNICVSIPTVISPTCLLLA